MLKCNIGAAQLLLKAGADPDAVNKDGTSAMELALQLDCGEGARVLVEGGADPDARRGGATLLMRAGHVGSTAFAQVLIDSGVDLSATDPIGNAALTYAAFGGNVELTRSLLAARLVKRVPSRSPWRRPLPR